VETILRITDISASPVSTRSNRGARAQQGLVAQWLREQATPSAGRTIEVAAIEPLTATAPARPRTASAARGDSRCGGARTQRSRSRRDRVPA
jgi:hypothetical protein